MDRDPALTVVLVAPNGLPQLRRTLLAIAAQTIADRIEALIVAPDESSMDGAEGVLMRFCAHRVLAVGPIENVDHAAARGLLAARAAIVASIEDHAFPEPDWAERLLAAYDDDCVAVGSAMMNANPSSLLSWSNMLIAYGQWSEATPAGDIEWVALHNGTYRRCALEPFGESLVGLFNREGEILLRLRDGGARFRFAPDARIRHVNPSSLRSTARLRFDAGRLYAANRAAAERWGRPKRLVYAALGPLIAPLRYIRMRRGLFGTRRDLTEPRHGPALLIGLIFDAAGQITGFLAGPGGSRERLATFEMDRLQHLNRSDARHFAPIGAYSNPSADIGQNETH